MHSLWTDTVTMPTFPSAQHDERADVLVIGGGIAGLLCAYELQQAGLSVMVAEAGRVAAGVTACTTAKLTAQHGGRCYTKRIADHGEAASRLYYEAQQRAMAHFDALAERFPCDAQTVDALLYARTDAEDLWREQEAIRRSGGEAERVRADLPFLCKGVLRLPRQRQFHPLKLLGGIARELTVFEHTRVRELREGVAVTDNGVTLFAQHVVVATHFPFVNRYGLYPVKLHQQRSYVLALRGADAPEEMLLDAADHGIQLRRYREWTLMSGASHRTGKAGQAWKPLEQAAAAWFPHAEITHRFATQDCCTADEMAYIGHYAKHAPAWQVVTGFNGWGMSGALIAAELVTAAITGTPSPYAALFSPGRHVPAAPLAKNVAESVGGLLTPTAPRCTHLGCALHWNPWEHSWDCACHGSRFAEDGTLLNGPATDGLKRKAED